MVADTVHTTPLTLKSQAARRGPAPLELVAAPGAPTHKTQKIRIVASLAHVEVNLTAAKDHEALKALYPEIM